MLTQRPFLHITPFMMHSSISGREINTRKVAAGGARSSCSLICSVGKHNKCSQTLRECPAPGSHSSSPYKPQEMEKMWKKLSASGETFGRLQLWDLRSSMMSLSTSRPRATFATQIIPGLFELTGDSKSPQTTSHALRHPTAMWSQCLSKMKSRTEVGAQCE